MVHSTTRPRSASGEKVVHHITSVKLLMLDEVHNILAGSAKEQRVMLNTLRYISNELQISLVCLGIGDAREAIGGDVQLMRRFDELSLPRWQGDAEFQELIDVILRHLLLKLASQLSARALRQVLQATDGVTARIFGMFNDLAIAAIRSGTECIDDTSVEAWRPIGNGDAGLCMTGALWLLACLTSLRASPASCIRPGCGASQSNTASIYRILPDTLAYLCPAPQ